jgi:nitrogen fixation NifU-like protein
MEQRTAEEMRKVYSEQTVDHVLNPRNLGKIPSPDGFARITGPCGDTMEIYLRIRDGEIVDASFQTDGCGATIAAGSMTTEMAKGKRVSEALKISPQDVSNALGGLPQDSQHCALLAINTLREAIREYFAFKNEPWKRAYRRS